MGFQRQLGLLFRPGAREMIVKGRRLEVGMGWDGMEGLHLGGKFEC